jgi:hypothetical protein
MQEDQVKEEATWEFHDESESTNMSSPAQQPSSFTPITWTGSEFIANQKGGAWYLGLIGFITLVCVVVYLISRDIVSVVFIAIMGVLFAVIASRKPRQLSYSIDEEGIKVGQRNYFFTDFKSFSLQHHGAIGYVSLLPLHRFRNELSIYFPPENEQAIFDALASHIPNEQRKETLTDKLVQLIRF